jgi:hypothetical protein
MRKILTVLLFVLLAGCPGLTNCKGTDPYATARLVIGGTQIAVQSSEAVFMAWAATQTDMEKVKVALAKFTKIKAAVLQGLQVALDGVDIAQQAKTDPDIKKLMAQAETAFQDLRKLLEGLLAKPTTQLVPKDPKAVKAAPTELEKMFEALPKTLLKGG